MSFDKVLAIPLRNGGLVKLLIGGVLNIIPIISFFSLGFIVDCYEKGSVNQQEMPDWSNWGYKFGRGFLAMVIGLIYMLIPVIIFYLIGFYSSPHLSGFAAGTLIFAVLIILIFGFCIPMAMCHYAVSKSFSAAFQIGYIFKLIGVSLGSYIGAYLLYFLAGIICLIISLIPFIGWLFVIFAGFYLACVAGFLFGAVYYQASQVVKDES